MKLNTSGVPNFDTQKIAVAVSGGVDSVVLCHLISKIAIPTILHVNYKLRGSASDLDQKFVETLAKSIGAPVEVVVAKQKCNQEQARNLRYDLFRKAIADGYIVATAHHQDDLAETLLFRLARGSTFSALSGMSEFYEGMWKPLLQYSKKDILTYAKKHKIKFREDKSNLTTKYSRNCIRLNVLPELEDICPGATKHLATFSSDLREIASFCINTTKSVQTASGLHVEQLQKMPKTLQKMVLQDYLRKVSSDPSFGLSANQWQAIKGFQFKVVQLRKGWQICHAKGYLELRKSLGSEE